MEEAGGFREGDDEMERMRDLEIKEKRTAVKFRNHLAAFVIRVNS